MCDNYSEKHKKPAEEQREPFFIKKQRELTRKSKESVDSTQQLKAEIAELADHINNREANPHRGEKFIKYIVAELRQLSAIS